MTVERSILSPFLDHFRARETDLVLSVITDPEDPRFDLEKLIAKWESDS